MPAQQRAILSLRPKAPIPEHDKTTCGGVRECLECSIVYLDGLIAHADDPAERDFLKRIQAGDKVRLRLRNEGNG